MNVDRVRIVTWSGAVSLVMVLASSAWAQTTPVFLDVGDLGGGTSRCQGVSADGSVVTGASLDGNSKTQAFIWTTSSSIKGIGFLNATNQYSSGQGVDVRIDPGPPATVIVHVAGTAKNASNKNQAFHWVGDVQGVGLPMVAIPFLPGGDESNAQALRIHLGVTWIVGQSKTNGGKRGYNWNDDDGTVTDISGGDFDDTDAAGIGWRPMGTKIIVGTGQSTWWLGGGHHPEAFRWEDNPPDGIKGLEYVCGRGFQIAAGPNRLAESTANPADCLVHEAGPSTLDPEEIVITAGLDQILQTEHFPQGGGSRGGDDTLRPEGSSPDTSSDSRARATDAKARFTVGRSSYIGGLPGPAPNFWRPYEASLHDSKMKDGETPDHCGGLVKHFGLGFLSGHNSSEVLGISTTLLGDPSREGLVAVGYSGYLNTAVTNKVPDSDKEAVIWFLGDGHYGESGCTDLLVMDIQMYSLKTYLEGQGLDLGHWVLREARGISNNGNVVVGWGMYDPDGEGEQPAHEEGFVVYLDPNQLPNGACCYGTTCDDEDMLEFTCNQTSGDWKGAGTTCATTACCADPFADADDDGDVDQNDFGLFQACITGRPFTGSLPAGCLCFDRPEVGYPEGDVDVDEDDLAAFENCASGPDVAANPLCDGP